VDRQADRRSHGTFAFIVTVLLALSPLSGPASAGRSLVPRQAHKGTVTSNPIGILLPADVRQGERGSGSLAADPDSYAEIPAFRVFPLKVFLPRSAAGPVVFDDITLEVAGVAQRADAPIVFGAADRPATLPIVVKRASDGTTMNTFGLPIQPAAGGAAPVRVPPPAPGDFTTPPVCVDGVIQKIEGPVGGDSRETSVAVDGQPATIVAQTPRALYRRLPDNVPVGRHQLTLRKASLGVSFTVWVVRLSLRADDLNLIRGQTTHVEAQLSGPELWPASFRIDSLAVACFAPVAGTATSPP
jgi:hypothetical protein